MAFAPFRIESSVTDGVHRLRVAGEIDLATAPELARQLDRAGAVAAVEVDLAEVTFMDGCGLRVLLAARARSNGEGRPGLALVGASRPVRRLFDLAGFADCLADRSHG